MLPGGDVTAEPGVKAGADVSLQWKLLGGRVEPAACLIFLVLAPTVHSSFLFFLVKPSYLLEWSNWVDSIL